MMPIEILSAAGQKELGIDPLDVEQILLFAKRPSRARRLAVASSFA